MKREGKSVRIATLLIITCLPLMAGERDTDLEKLVSYMIGSFSSQEQAAEDESYFHIRLVMAPIWTDRKDGHWLYVEQAAVGYFDKPYRQRVYHVTRTEDGRFESAVYSLPDPKDAIGAWKADKPLADLKPEALEVRKGCSVFLAKQGDAYVGSTHEKDCESKLRGATYATSEIRIEKGLVLSWDRGFDAEDQHVWGAEKAGYIFKYEGSIADLKEAEPDPNPQDK